jgi:hypothetical protein
MDCLPFRLRLREATFRCGGGFTIVDKGMLRSSGSFLVISLAAGVASAAEIPQGAHVLLRMENSISTRTAQEGDYVYLRTASPVAMDGQIAVAAGSYVQGVVTQSKRSGRVRTGPNGPSGWRCRRS